MNKLRRKINVTYVPGDPPVPPTPPVCTVTEREVGTGGSSGGLTMGSSPPDTDDTLILPVYGPVPDPVLGTRRGIVGYMYARSSNGTSGSQYTSTTETTCTGGSPGTPGTPGEMIKEDAGPDWLASSRSIQRRGGGVVASFFLSARPRVAIGFATNDTGPAFRDLRMGILVEPSGPDVVVRSIIEGAVGGVVGTYSPGDRVALLRVGGRFKVQVGGVVLYDTETPTQDNVVLDAMLYTSDDYVDKPLFSLAVSETQISGALGVQAGLSGSTGVAGAVGLSAEAGTLVDGVAVVQVRGSVGYTATAASTGTVAVSVSGSVGLKSMLSGLATTAQVAVAIPALTMVAADGEYSIVGVSLPALTMSSVGGTPIMETAGSDLSLPTFGFYALTNTGGLVQSELELEPLEMLATDRPYAQVGMVMPAFTMDADSGYNLPGYALHVENMDLYSEIYTDPTLFASIQFGLELEPTMSFGVLVSGSMFDGLILDPSLSVHQFLLAAVESGLNLSSATQAPREGFGQYGFNLDSGAVTRYQGFDFRGFAYSPSGTYAFRKDGVYLLRHGDDDGEYRSAMADFGITGMGTMGKKHIETIYLGMSTDGRVYVKLSADGGQEKTYRVIQRDPTMRVRTGRGLTAREWSTKLEIVDASSVELDGVEFVVSASGRKWVR